jgi:hypothetical protein
VWQGEFKPVTWGTTTPVCAGADDVVELDGVGRVVVLVVVRTVRTAFFVGKLPDDDRAQAPRGHRC